MNKLFLEDYIQSFEEKINNKKLVNLSIPDSLFLKTWEEKCFLIRMDYQLKIFKKLKKNITKVIISRTPYEIFFGGAQIIKWYFKNSGEVISTTINKYLYLSCRALPPFININIVLFGKK